MIVKHVPIRSLGKSDFAGLASYITGTQGKTERIAAVSMTNCQAQSPEAAAIEILATQKINTRAKGDKTYHMLVSFPPGENPPSEVLKDIEVRLCAGLGLGDHQRMSAVHHDTDHLHMHIAINKIHPARYTMHEPFQAYRTLAGLCETLEKEHGLQRVNHEKRRSLSECHAADMEAHAGIESLLSWVRRECLDEIRGARSWKDLHRVMRENGLELRKRANGFVIESKDKIVVKASTVARDLSKPSLEKRLGPFEAPPERKPQAQGEKCYRKRPIRFRVDTTLLYARYRSERQENLVARSAERKALRNLKNSRIEAVKRSNRLRRASIKFLGRGRLAKRLLYAQAFKALQKEIRRAQDRYRRDSRALTAKYQRETWADWLKQQALKGDPEALAALRARQGRRNLKGNTLAGEKREPAQDRSAGAVVDNITKRGTIIYRAGICAVRDDGERLQVSRNATGAGVQVALRLAAQRYGRIEVNGTPGFKARVIQTAVLARIPVTFADPDLESRRRDLLKKEDHDDRENKGEKAERGRTDRRSPGRAGPRAGKGNAGSAATDKPNIGRVGQAPPPRNRNRLRELSELDVVRIARGGQVLLPGNVSHHLEQPETERADALRRDPLWAGLTKEAVEAADKYIAEREEKRKMGLDVPKHTCYEDGDGPLSFAGIRNINGRALALIKREDSVVMILPVDQTAAYRLKRVAIGAAVTVTARGTVRTKKGRGR